MKTKKQLFAIKTCAVVILVAVWLSGTRTQAAAQVAALQQTPAAGCSSGPEPAGANRSNAEILKELEQMRGRMQELEQMRGRILELEATLKAQQGPVAQPPSPAKPDQAGPSGKSAPEAAIVSKDDQPVLEFLRETTINGVLDGYYAYNFNAPIGRVNLLRAYDVSSNSFSLNQASFIIERAPDVSAGRRMGVRLDFQYGQATETLQGSPVNEPRPQVYRPLFQAYGTYIFPVGSGLTVDFGKWASAMGYENNYTKDQFNYSRSYFFNFLPFYHMGFRTTYNLNDHVALGYWLVNGTQQTEDFNGFKSQVVQAVLKPASTVQWNFIYHVGQEQRDLVAALNPGLPSIPTQPGLSTSSLTPTPDGRLHILDTYLSWNATPRLTLVGEADYVINRVFAHSAPAHVTGGAAYAHYQLTSRVGLAARGEYLSDRGGLFSGVTQALKETTLTYDYKVAEGFLVRTEWRRDFSNQPFFLTSLAGNLKKEQSTATLGLLWWFGQKQGSW
ncbi:MAG: porin [Acidobacteriia bacterium]|nr:porin [Terriglobia bacterium]